MSVKKFVAARKQHRGAGDTSMVQMLDSFTAELKKLIINHKISSANDISTIMSELNESPYGDSRTASIIECLEKCMMDVNEDYEPIEAEDDGTSGKSKLTTWWNYFTESDWKALASDGKSWWAITELAVHRASSFGCCNPNETSVKWLMALLLVIHYKRASMPNPLHKYRPFNGLKALFDSASKCGDGIPTKLSEYPRDPSELPSEMQACYLDDPAVNKDKHPDITSVPKIAKIIPMRKTSALLEGTPEHEFERTPLPTKKIKPPGRSTSSLLSAAINVEPDVKTEPVKACSVEPHKCIFCPWCGHNLRETCSPVKAEPDEPAKAESVHVPRPGLDAILRVNGTPLQNEPVSAESELKSEPVLTPPVLDAHAQAAIDALQTRKELRAGESKKQREADRKAAKTKGRRGEI